MDVLDGAKRYREYMQSGLNKEVYLQSLPVEEREQLTAYLASIRNAVKEELLSLISAKPTRAKNDQGRMGRIGKTYSSEILD